LNPAEENCHSGYE